MTTAILTLNAGSSSIKFSVYEAGDEPRELGHGQVEKLGPNAVLHVAELGEPPLTEQIGQADHAKALTAILTHLEPILEGRQIAVVGHRIVHGGPEFAAPVVLTDAILDHLASFERLAPLHQPFNLLGVRAAIAAFPDARQVGCFDTAFHRGHPWVHDTYALPQEFYDRGVRRYGFHGLSYDFVSRELARIAPELATARVIIAHLGNGASMCAMKDGQSLTCTMGFSPLDGLVMGTRCGDMDPGVLLYLLEQEGMDVTALTRLLYKESGLKGLSGLTHDMRTLLASDDPNAGQAVDYYVGRICHEVGALTADLGGLDALVFTGGVGENSDDIRARVARSLHWLGVSIDSASNVQNALEIGSGAVRVFAIPTNEERVIARAANATV